MNTMSIVVLRTQIQCSPRLKNVKVSMQVYQVRSLKTVILTYWLRKSQRSWSLNSNTL